MQISDLRVLIMGCGSIGKRHARVLYDLGVKNMAAYDPSPAARAAFSELYPGCAMYEEEKEALDSFKADAVFILSPSQMHIPMANRAIEAGAHIFIEKPLSTTPDSAEQLQALADCRSKKVMVGFCFRYHEALLYAKQLLEQGTIGRLLSIRCLMGEPFAKIRPDYRDTYYARYSGAFELVHDLDLAIWLAAQPIVEVQGMYGTHSDMEITSPDTVEMLLRFQDRVMASVHLDFYQQPRRRQVDLLGTDGTIIVDISSWDEASVSVGRDETWVSKRFTTRRNDMFTAEDYEFLTCIVEDKPIRCTIAESLKSLKAVASVYQFSQEKTSM